MPYDLQGNWVNAEAAPLDDATQQAVRQLWGLQQLQARSWGDIPLRDLDLSQAAMASGRDLSNPAEYAQRSYNQYFSPAQAIGPGAEDPGWNAWAEQTMGMGMNPGVDPSVYWARMGGPPLSDQSGLAASLNADYAGLYKQMTDPLSQERINQLLSMTGQGQSGAINAITGPQWAALPLNVRQQLEGIRQSDFAANQANTDTMGLGGTLALSGFAGLTGAGLLAPGAAPWILAGQAAGAGIGGGVSAGTGGDPTRGAQLGASVGGVAGGGAYGFLDPGSAAPSVQAAGAYAGQPAANLTSDITSASLVPGAAGSQLNTGVSQFIADPSFAAPASAGGAFGAAPYAGGALAAAGVSPSGTDALQAALLGNALGQFGSLFGGETGRPQGITPPIGGIGTPQGMMTAQMPHVGGQSEKGPGSIAPPFRNRIYNLQEQPGISSLDLVKQYYS